MTSRSPDDQPVLCIWYARWSEVNRRFAPPRGSRRSCYRYGTARAPAVSLVSGRCAASNPPPLVGVSRRAVIFARPALIASARAARSDAVPHGTWWRAGRRSRSAMHHLPAAPRPGYRALCEPVARNRKPRSADDAKSDACKERAGAVEPDGIVGVHLHLEHGPASGCECARRSRRGEVAAVGSNMVEALGQSRTMSMFVVVSAFSTKASWPTPVPAWPPLPPK